MVIRLGLSDPALPVSFLFTGDAEKVVEDEMVQRFGDGLRTMVLKAGHHGSNSSTSEEFLRRVRPAHVVISSVNQKFSGVMLPRQETFQRIKNVSDALGLNTQVWHTDRDDKEPVVIPVGQEAGCGTVVARTDGKTLKIDYADSPGGQPVAAAPQCEAMTLKGKRCERVPVEGIWFCWQHGGT